MKIFIKHILRNLKENKKRTFLIMLSLIFTSMFISIIISAINLVSNMETVIIDELTSRFDYDIKNKDDSPITKIQEETVLNDVVKVGIHKNFGYIKIDNTDYLMDIYGTDTTISYKVGFFSENNNQGIELKENEIIVLEDELKHLNLKIGDKITFYNSKGNQYDLVIAKAIKNDILLQYKKNEYYTFATNLETFKKITEIEKLDNYRYYISFDKELNEAEKSQFEDKCDEAGMIIRETPISNSVTSIFEVLIPIFAVIILLLGVIVYFVNNSFVKIILNERIPIMGTFRSLGATSKTVNKILLIEMALYGLFSGVVGAVIGFSISHSLIKLLLVPFFENNISGYSFEFLLKTVDDSAFSILIISIICTTIFQIILSLNDILASNKISIKDCIFSKYDDIQIYDSQNIIYGLTFLLVGIISILLKHKLNTFWGILGLIFLFVSISKLLPYVFLFIFSKIKMQDPVGKIAIGNIFNSKLQIRSSTILCILISVMILLVSFANETKQENLNVEDKYSFDSYIRVSSCTDEDINDISFVNGVESVATLYTALPSSDEMLFANNLIFDFMFLATDNADILLKTNKSYGEIGFDTLNHLSNNEIVISADDAKKYGIHIGDYIYLNNIIKKENFSVELPVYVKVVGLHDYLHSIAFISIDLMNKLDTLEVVSITKELFILSENDTNITKSINEMLETKNVSDKAKTLSEFIEDKQSETTISYVVIIIICIVLSLIVLICLANNQKISFLQRKRDFAILNSICMSKKQLKKIITTEIMISYIVSTIIAIIYSIIITNIVSYIINAHLKLTILSIATIFIIMAMVMYLVSIKIRNNINKMNIIDEIKYE